MGAVSVEEPRQPQESPCPIIFPEKCYPVLPEELQVIERMVALTGIEPAWRHAAPPRSDGCWPSSDASQLAGVLLNPADGFGNLLHIGAFTQQPGLIEPHSFLAQLVILRTLIA